MHDGLVHHQGNHYCDHFESFSIRVLLSHLQRSLESVKTLIFPRCFIDSQSHVQSVRVQLSLCASLSKFKKY